MSDRLWQADMARVVLQDLLDPSPGEDVEDLHNYLHTLNPWCEDDQAEWDRVADEIEYRANRASDEMDAAEYEYEMEMEYEASLRQQEQDGGC